MHCPASHVSPGEHSQAVRHCAVNSGTQTWAAQSVQVGQLGTQAQRYPLGQVAVASGRVWHVEIGAGHTDSGRAASAARAPVAPTASESVRMNVIVENMKLVDPVRSADIAGQRSRVSMTLTGLQRVVRSA